MKQVIIHAGFHKTATSSIQETCTRNRETLKELGFYYPLFKLGQRVIKNHSAPFYSLFTSKPDKYHVNVQWGVDTGEANQEYEAQLNQILQQKHKKILISGEGISSLSQLELNKMRKKIQSHGYEIRMIVFVRSPSSHIHSAMQQKVKSGYSIGALKIPKRTNIIDRIESVFPEAEFFSFRDTCRHKYGPVGYFLEIIGVTDFSNLEFIRSNDSLSGQAIRLMSFINKEQPFFQEKSKINPFRRNGDTNLLGKIKGDKFLLNQIELQQFQEQIDLDNKYLLNKFGASFCDQKIQVSLDSKAINWSDEQLEQLKSAISKVDENIKIITYDYFRNIIGLNNRKLSDIFLKNNHI